MHAHFLYLVHIYNWSLPLSCGSHLLFFFFHCKILYKFVGRFFPIFFCILIPWKSHILPSLLSPSMECLSSLLPDSCPLYLPQPTNKAPCSKCGINPLLPLSLSHIVNHRGMSAVAKLLTFPDYVQL